MKASQSIHQFMPLQKSSGGLNWCPSIHHPSTTEKISISLRPGLGLRSPIVERKKEFKEQFGDNVSMRQN